MRRGLAIFLVAVGCGDPPVDLDPDPCQLLELPDDAVTVRTAAELDAIRERSELSSLCVFDASGVEQISLPNLRRASGAIAIRDCRDLDLVSMPALESAGRIK